MYDPQQSKSSYARKNTCPWQCNSYFVKDGCILIQKMYPGSSASKGTVPEIRFRHYIRGATLFHNLLCSLWDTIISLTTDVCLTSQYTQPACCFISLRMFMQINSALWPSPFCKSRHWSLTAPSVGHYDNLRSARLSPPRTLCARTTIFTSTSTVYEQTKSIFFYSC